MRRLGVVQKARHIAIELGVNNHKVFGLRNRIVTRPLSFREFPKVLLAKVIVVPFPSVPDPCTKRAERNPDMATMGVHAWMHSRWKGEAGCPWSSVSGKNQHASKRASKRANKPVIGDMPQASHENPACTATHSCPSLRRPASHPT
jgi:hypothetical protein